MGRAKPYREPSSSDGRSKILALGERVTEPVRGFFGPGSMTWQINSEAAIYLGGMRALLLQLAHPKVAQAVADHSNFRGDPFGRLRRTFDTVHAMVFGDRDHALEAAVRLYDVHERIAGRLPDDLHAPDPTYRANDPDLLLWVYATLVDSALESYATFVAAPSDAETERFYEESKVFARLVAIDAASIPGDYRAFRTYTDAMMSGPELCVSAAAAEVAGALLRGPSFFFLFRPANYVLAAGMLPERLRTQFRLGWSVASRLAFRAGASSVRAALPYLPPQLRYVPSARRAQRRCAEHAPAVVPTHGP